MTQGTPLPPPTTISGKVRKLATRIGRGLSLSRLQSIVAILAGSVTVVGAAFSIPPSAKSAATGQLVASIRAASSQRPIADATVEVLTAENALVATLTPDAAGRATAVLREGTYVVRITHPRYTSDVRRIEVQPHQTIEIKTALRAGSSSPGRSVTIDRTVNKGVSFVRRALGF